MINVSAKVVIGNATTTTHNPMPTKKKKNKWIKTGGGNEVLSTKWGRISYNPNTGNAFGRLTTLLLNIHNQNVEDGEETALYDNKVWRILTGDFRKQYTKLFPNLKKCIAFYESQKKKHRNNYSTD